MGIEFDGITDPTGLGVYDPIEQRHLRIRTPGPVTPNPVCADQFCFPVDTACSIETSALIFDQLYFVDVHDETGQTDCNLEAGEHQALDESTQFVGLSGPIKIYCRISESGTIETGIDSVHLSFDDLTEVTIGARSLHEQPAGSIRTPEDPESMMTAISALPSALKTTSPERSWPNLRGHPPLIELGDELDVPFESDVPSTDVTIEVPPSYRELYTVAPLSFYLGATVRPGDEPRLRTDQFEYDLGVERRLEDDAARVLKQTFLLDCIVRMEGLYRYDLHERTALESKLPFDLATVYDEPLSTRLERYLGIPYETVEPHIPRWPLTAHVPSTSEGIETIPFVVNELGVVREPRGEIVETEPTGAKAEAEAGARVRAGAGAETGTDRGRLVRSAGVRSHRSPVFDEDDELTVVEPDVRDESIEHAWFGGNVPRGASKATLTAYRNQLSREPRNESIEILLVCNDAQMVEEHDVLDGAYGDRESLPFDIHSEFGVSTDRLASLLTDGGYDFLHYIGHATPDGLHCPDGKLDVRTLSSVDVSVFFLNACRSYEQGLALTERGSFGGVATLSDIVNEHAVEVGETVAQLLNLGFPLRAALELARESTVFGEQYLIVGDGSVDIAQSEGGAPVVCSITERGGEYYTSLSTYPTKEFRLGSVSNPSLRSFDMKYLSPSKTDSVNVSTRELETYLRWTKTPVVHEDVLRWNGGLDPIL